MCVTSVRLPGSCTSFLPDRCNAHFTSPAMEDVMTILGQTRKSVKAGIYRTGAKKDIRPKGVAIVWVAVLGVLLITLVGLAMDSGVVYLAGTHLQVAADASALAGAQFVRDPNPLVPRNHAQAIALENKALGTPVSLDPNAGNADTGDIVLGHYYRFSNSSNCMDQTP